MELENYRDLSSLGTNMSSGFQFEFSCSNCSRTWKSPFKPFRTGQFTDLLARLSWLMGKMDTAARVAQGFGDYGSRKARDEALAEATQHAKTLYTVCSKCRKAVCEDCLGASGDTCQLCADKSTRERMDGQAREADGAREQAANACPNCGTSAPGGRFCAECGFDRASTHKSCPGCGAMTLRQARFCTDCGHGF